MALESAGGYWYFRYRPSINRLVGRGAFGFDTGPTTRARHQGEKLILDIAQQAAALPDFLRQSALHATSEQRHRVLGDIDKLKGQLSEKEDELAVLDARLASLRAARSAAE